MKRESIIRIGLVLFSLLLAGLIFELFLRFIDYTYTPLRIQVQFKTDWRDYHIFQDKNFVADPYLIWRPREVTSVFNAQGYRGQELSPDKEPGSVRIFAIGDSNTLGWNTENGPNWPLYLEQLLNKTDNRFTVTNAGAWGYSSFQGLRRFDQALVYQPDIVFISFGGNDPHRVTMSDAEFADQRARIASFYLGRALNKLKIGQLILALSDKFLLKEKEVLIPRVSLPEYEANLNKIIRLAKARNIQIVLLTRPFIGEPLDELSWKNFASSYNATTLAVANRNYIPVIDIYSYFEGKEEYFVDESHFNEAGHLIAAQLIHDNIKPLLQQLQVAR